MPATLANVQAAAQKLGFTVPAEHEKEYLTLFGSTDRSVAAIMSYPDYQIPVDEAKFPRLDVHLATQEEMHHGWAWKATINGTPGGILDGKTVCFKDTICVAGVPQLFGTTAVNFTPISDATVVTRTLEHGGTVVGKAMCENFSHGPSSHSTPFGPVENPYATGFATGGSSSGCGALIGAGVVDMGVGGDQGGSIRIPAVHCGLVGVKPTLGLVPYTGVLSSDPAVDTVGPMARTAYDAALLLQAIAGYDQIDDRQLGAPLPADVPAYSEIVLSRRSKGLKGLKIGVLKEGFEDKSMDPNVAQKCREAIAKFAELGAVVEEVSVPLHKLTGPLCHVLNKFASSQTRQGRQVSRRGLYINEYWERLMPWTQEKYEKAMYYVTGTSMCAEYGWSEYPTAYGRAMNLSRRLRDEYDALLAKYDVIVLPTVTQPPRRHVPWEKASPVAWADAGPGLITNTAATNMTGHPSVTFPVGFVPPSPGDILKESDKDIRLPTGLMVMGKFWDDATLLSVVDSWEQKYDWRKF